MAQQLIYKVVIYRVDGNDLEVLESEDVNKVKNMYKGLEHEWISSTAEKRPFKMPEPHIHSFLPSFISEIKVHSMSKEEYQAQSNPYYQQMQREGTSGVLNKNFNNGGF